MNYAILINKEYFNSFIYGDKNNEDMVTDINLSTSPKKELSLETALSIIKIIYETEKFKHYNITIVPINN